MRNCCRLTWWSSASTRCLGTTRSESSDARASTQPQAQTRHGYGDKPKFKSKNYFNPSTCLASLAWLAIALVSIAVAALAGCSPSPHSEQRPCSVANTHSSAPPGLAVRVSLPCVTQNPRQTRAGRGEHSPLGLFLTELRRARLLFFRLKAFKTGALCSEQFGSNMRAGCSLLTHLSESRLISWVCLCTCSWSCAHGHGHAHMVVVMRTCSWSCAHCAPCVGW